MSRRCVVADHGSTDGSSPSTPAARAWCTKQQGLWQRAARGIACARRYVSWSTRRQLRLHRARSLRRALRGGVGPVMGNRFRAASRAAHALLHRYLGNPVLSGVGRLFSGARSRLPLRPARFPATPCVVWAGDRRMEFASEMGCARPDVLRIRSARDAVARRRSRRRTFSAPRRLAPPEFLCCEPRAAVPLSGPRCDAAGLDSLRCAAAAGPRW